ncbi:MAG: Uma2 family endonuclease [Bacteroidetes bacterium]|nr:Uma2 family endonuclease [Bacteroidota bacterium]
MEKNSAMLRDAEIIEPILENLHMPELVEELNARWKQEQRLREEFYEKIQPGDKWEFINGKIIMHSPAKEKHTEARQKLSMLLQIFVSVNDLGQVKDETALVALSRNDYLPDILYFTKERTAGIHANTWKYPIPDLIVEVLSDSTSSTDRGIKKQDYAAHGAREYWLIDPDLQLVEQYLLDEAKKEFWLFTKKTTHDRIECKAIVGLSFPVAAIFDEQVKMQVVKEWLK